MPASPSDAAPRLELTRAEGAFAAIEEFLRDRGFFTEDGSAGSSADLYLGYGLSSTIRRRSSPAPPEPCPLPLAACVVRGDASVPAEYGKRHRDEENVGHGSDGGHDDALAFGDWNVTWDAADYGRAVASVRAAIAAGDVYQVNLVQHLSAELAENASGAAGPSDLAGRASRLAGALAPLAPLHPTPFLGDGWAVVSASPELFLARRGRRLWTRPIKGTRPLGRRAELERSEKDAAEHVMIVDLERNDLSRVCEAGSVRWPDLMATGELAGVEHMVSTVEGRLREDVGLAEILEATFPGGSVTGAPKIAAVDLIAELEPVGRGASMGAIGRVHQNGDFELALTIRTFALAEGRIHLWVGGGVVWDSEPDSEVAESWTKARPLLEAIGAPFPEEALT